MTVIDNFSPIFKSICGPSSSSYYSGNSQGQVCQEGLLGSHSNFFGLCKFRIYEDDRVQEGKSAVKDNEVAVNDLMVWLHA